MRLGAQPADQIKSQLLSLESPLELWSVEAVAVLVAVRFAFHCGCVLPDAETAWRDTTNPEYQQLILKALLFGSFRLP